MLQPETFLHVVENRFQLAGLEAAPPSWQVQQAVRADENILPFPAEDLGQVDSFF